MSESQPTSRRIANIENDNDTSYKSHLNEETLWLLKKGVTLVNYKTND